MRTLFDLNLSDMANAHTACFLIKGKTLKKGNPLSCPVRAYAHNTGKLMSVSTSDANGSYLLFGAADQQNYVVAIDPDGQFNAVIQDGVIPK